MAGDIFVANLVNVISFVQKSLERLLLFLATIPLACAESSSPAITVGDFVAKAEAHFGGIGVPRDYGQAYLFLK